MIIGQIQEAVRLSAIAEITLHATQQLTLLKAENVLLNNDNFERLEDEIMHLAAVLTNQDVNCHHYLDEPDELNQTHYVAFDVLFNMYNPQMRSFERKHYTALIRFGLKGAAHTLLVPKTKFIEFYKSNQNSLSCTFVELDQYYTAR